MVMVWRKAALYAPAKGSVSTWIFTIVRNLRVDRFRWAKGIQFSDLSDFEIESNDPPSDIQVNTKQEGSRVSSAIEPLPEEQRQVVHLAFIEDLTLLEIAEKLGQPLGTVKSRMRLVKSGPEIAAAVR